MAEPAPRRGSLFPEFPITAEDTVLDVGCGTGVDSIFAGRLGAAVIALDCGPRKVEALREAMRDVPARSFRAIQTECDPIPLPDATADVVLCKEVLEPDDDPAALLAELARVGRPAARYLISVPDPASEAMLRAVAPGWYFEKPFHQHVFEHEQLDALARKAGLRVERRASCGAYHAFWWALRFAGDPAFDPRRDPHAPPPPIVGEWEQLWAKIAALPGGGPLIAHLDATLPRGQVLVASKPVTATRRWWSRREPGGAAGRPAGRHPGRSAPNPA